MTYDTWKQATPETFGAFEPKKKQTKLQKYFSLKKTNKTKKNNTMAYFKRDTIFIKTLDEKTCLKVQTFEQMQGIEIGQTMSIMKVYHPEPATQDEFEVAYFETFEYLSEKFNQ